MPDLAVSTQFVFAGMINRTGSSAFKLVAFLVAVLPRGAAGSALAAERALAQHSIATFSEDVTPPLGHSLFASHIRPAEKFGDRLSAKGIVLIDGNTKVVLVAVDWCEIRGDAYQRWQSAIAEAVGTTPDRVLVSAVHQHDAPLADLAAERLLNERGVNGKMIDLNFHEKIVQRVAKAAAASLQQAKPVTHVGFGSAKVEHVASNRRYLEPDGTPRHGRMSRMSAGYAKGQPEGTIDPWLKTISFWDGDRPLAALSSYATHPMSSYGGGRVSADFPGLAREKRQAEMPDVLQVYMSGASGNVTAGKFNDGSDESRAKLIDRMHAAMRAAWAATVRQSIGRITFRSAALKLNPRDEGRYRVSALQEVLQSSSDPKQQAWAALGLSWWEQRRAGKQIVISAIDLGPAQFVLLPAESYVEFQLLAQQLRPESFVMVAGYGECGPGYIPTEQAWAENDSNLDDWCWITPGAEAEMRRALKEVLSVKSN